MKNSRKYLLLALLVGAGALLSSCVVRGGARFHATPDYQPQLVEVSPGIWVVEDYHESVFYNDGYYWRYHGGTWYRSHYHTRGWVHVNSHIVPRAVVRIDRPGRYVRYRATSNARRRQPDRRPNYRVPANRGHNQGHRSAPAVRDHRSAPAVRDHRSAPPARDHRSNRPAREQRYDKNKKQKDDRRRPHR